MRHRSLQETGRRSGVTNDVVPAKTASGAPRSASRWTARAVFLLVLAGLFVAYLRLSKKV